MSARELRTRRRGRRGPDDAQQTAEPEAVDDRERRRGGEAEARALLDCLDVAEVEAALRELRLPVEVAGQRLRDGLQRRRREPPGVRGERRRLRAEVERQRVRRVEAVEVQHERGEVDELVVRPEVLQPPRERREQRGRGDAVVRRHGAQRRVEVLCLDGLRVVARALLDRHGDGRRVLFEPRKESHARRALA